MSTVRGGQFVPRLAGALACVLVILDLPGSAPASSSHRQFATAPPLVSVFPIPGGRVASPSTQIVFRGVPASQLGSIRVTGSVSSTHGGTVRADSDGQGGSFLPGRPFTAGEVVTVTTSPALNIVGASNGTFQFTVATPRTAWQREGTPAAARVPGDVLRYRSRPDLAPAAVMVTKRSRRSARGDIFVAPQFGPIQNGPEIFDANGNLVWFKRVPSNYRVTDFRVQRYQGQPVLTWWQGYFTAAIAVGEGVINDASYKQIAIVKTANGASADQHEFQITPWGTALLDAYYPVYWDASSVHGPKRQLVLDSIVQEIDIPTGLVLFQWDSLDHVPLTDSYAAITKDRVTFDYFHLNSIEPDRDGNLLLSGRNTFAAYKVSHQTGAVIWTLGGKHSSFRFGSGASFAFQHDVRVRAQNDLYVTLFDDGAGLYTVHPQSRGLKLRLDVAHGTATVAGQYLHAPPVLSGIEGNVQQLPNHNEFVGWGQWPYFTEYDTRGRLLFAGQFVGQNDSYRDYRFAWRGMPKTVPRIAATQAGNRTIVYASWNGATKVALWRVLGGNSANSLRPAGTARNTRFETAIAVGALRFVAVQALDGHGHTLATSATIAS